LKWLEHIFDFLASIKLAIFVILSLAVVSAVGTIVEARFDAQVAQKLVYHSPYMLTVLGLLVVNLVAVMIDRWPWKAHHAGFVLAHIGIILTLGGALITQKFGVDGTMAFEIGQSNRHTTVNSTELAVYAADDTGGLALVRSQPVDFLLQPPNRYPVEFELGSERLSVSDYFLYAVRQSEIKSSDRPTDGSAIRIQLRNDNVNISQWLFRAPGQSQAEANLGPAKVIWTQSPFDSPDGNALVLYPGQVAGEVRYSVFTKSKGGLTSSGRLQEGSSVEVGWMGLTLRLIQYLPKAHEQVTYVKKERPNQFTRSAIQLKFGDSNYWVGLNSVLRLYSGQKMYVVTYAQRRLDIGFNMRLDRFHIGHYQGTTRAASYESLVSVEGVGEALISMNEPLKHNGFTFYQASFEQDESGKPVASILSVNYDPGRWIKYLGSLLIVLGSIVLFYFKTWVVRRKLKQQEAA